MDVLKPPFSLLASRGQRIWLQIKERQILWTNYPISQCIYYLSKQLPNVYEHDQEVYGLNQLGSFVFVLFCKIDLTGHQGFIKAFLI